MKSITRSLQRQVIIIEKHVAFYRVFISVNKIQDNDYLSQGLV